MLCDIYLAAMFSVKRNTKMNTFVCVWYTLALNFYLGGGVKDQFSNSFMVVFKNSEILVNKMKNKKYNTV
jgi:hypothetical protein